jgi:hypothetical protein
MWVDGEGCNGSRYYCAANILAGGFSQGRSAAIAPSVGTGRGDRFGKQGFYEANNLSRPRNTKEKQFINLKLSKSWQGWQLGRPSSRGEGVAGKLGAIQSFQGFHPLP